MKYIEHELQHLKNRLIEMWDLTQSQLDKATESLITGNHQLAREVEMRERIVNAVDLQIDSECENIIALYAPVAIDLRFVMAMMRISNDLERIADFCYDISIYVLKNEADKPLREIIDLIQLKDMIAATSEMLRNGNKALQDESSFEAIRVFDMDKKVDAYNTQAVELLGEYIKYHPENGKDCLLMYGMVRRLERLGDHCTNIAEELIFYLDAKVLRHKNKFKT